MMILKEFSRIVCVSLFSYQGSLFVCLSDSLFTLPHLIDCVKYFFEVFYFFKIQNLKRRRRDLNPRAAINDLLPFQGSPFSLLGTSPNKLTNKRYSISIPVDTAEKVGFEPTAPCGVTGFQDQLLKPLGHLSIALSLHGRSHATIDILSSQKPNVNN